LNNYNSQYLVSAIVSTYNSERFIKGKIEDLLNQTTVDKLEIIIVNSGSQQNEDSIINEFCTKYPNIRYIKTEKRETIYKAWNRGIKEATGKFITNSNTDDRLKDNAFEILASELIKSPDIGLVYANQCISTIPNQTFCEAEKKNVLYFPSYNYLHLLDRCLVGSQPMWRASIHFKDGIWFNEKFEVCGDHDFEIRIAEKYDLKHINLVLGTFYKSTQKTNKEYQNPLNTHNEVSSITFYHTQKYLNSLNSKQLKKLLNSNKLLVSMPLLFYRILNKLKCNLFPKLHFQYPEFTYLLTVLINRKLGNYEKVLYYSNKFLKSFPSKRIMRVQESVKKTSDNQKLILSLENEE
jgi:glycosyltransferase involved in cell wall biosynthesis